MRKHQIQLGVFKLGSCQIFDIITESGLALLTLLQYFRNLSRNASRQSL